MNRTIGSLGIALIIALTCVIGMERAFAQNIFTMDAAGFQQREGLVYQEIYFLIQRDRLKFVQNAEGFEAQYRIKVDLCRDDSVLSSTAWEMVDHALKLEDITPRQKLPDIVVYNLFPGNYDVKGSVTDLNQKVTYTNDLPLTLKSFPDSLLALSDIELAMKLQRGEEGSKFYKNGFLIIPNPERIYGTSLPMLYYYTEIYNLIPGDGTYTVQRSILDGEKNLINRLPRKCKKKAGRSVVEVDGFSVVSLRSGTYYLRITVDDDDTQQSDSADVKFFVYRPEDFTTQPEVAGKETTKPFVKEIENYTEKELSDAVEELKYLLTDSEWYTVKKLNPNGQRLYLIKYWTESDPDTTTPVNEFRVMFEKRKKLADEKYGIWDTPGWKTPRGRILILYGEPDYIEYHPHDPATRSYEVWFYDALEGGVQFVFVDRNNFGDYRLVHSNKKGEIFRPNWFEDEALIRKP